MSSHQSPSSIPRRARITSDHFRPLPSDVPSTPSAPLLMVNRKRPRAEARHQIYHEQAHSEVNIAPSGATRTFSANFGQTQQPQTTETHHGPFVGAPVADLQALLATDITPIPIEDNTSSFLSATLAQRQQPNSTWKIPLVGVAATVAGRVWNFVSSNTFLGFRAGGGTAYDMGSGSAEPLAAESRQSEGSSLRTGRAGKATRQFSWGAPNLPGHFPRDEESQGAEQVEEQSPSRGAKRRQVSQKGDWVIVEPETESSTPTPKSPPQSHIPRLSSPRAPSTRRRSYLALPTSTPRRVNSTAYNTIGSNTSSRRTSTFTHSLTTKPLRSARSFSSFPASASPDIATTEGQPRTPRGSRDSAAHTLTSTDVAKFRAKKEREERLQDASMRKLNEQLRAMIKEGKAALGTRVEVDLDGEEEE